MHVEDLQVLPTGGYREDEEHGYVRAFHERGAGNKEVHSEMIRMSNDDYRRLMRILDSVPQLLVFEEDYSVRLANLRSECVRLSRKLRRRHYVKGGDGTKV